MRILTLILSLLCINALAGITPEGLKARKELEAKASAGDVVAQRTLGVGYYEGGEATCWIVNYIEAHKWLRKAADSGDAKAQSTLAEAFYCGRGVPVNKVEAAKWYTKASKQGDENAIKSLACMYGDGDGIKMNLVESYALFCLSGQGVNDNNPAYTPAIKAAGQRRLAELQKEQENRILNADAKKANK